MKQYLVEEMYYALENQRVFLFGANKSDITIKINGQQLVHEEDYTVNQENHLVLNDTVMVHKGDLIEQSFQLISNNKFAELISPGEADKFSSIIKKATETETLLKNNKYEVNIVAEKEPVTFHFVSKLSPLFSTVKRVREDCAEFAEDFTDEYILSLIHQNSKEVVELVETLKEDNIENVTIKLEEESGEYILSAKTVNDWVRYKTDIELIYAKFYGMSANYGTVEKMIGEIQISKVVRLPNITWLLDRFRHKWEEANNEIKVGQADFSTHATKGSSNFVYSNRPTF